MPELPHSDPDCIGTWTMIPIVRAGELVEPREIICTRCAARHPFTPENRNLAIDENYAGIYLRRLTNEGQRRRDLEQLQ